RPGAPRAAFRGDRGGTRHLPPPLLIDLYHKLHRALRFQGVGESQVRRALERLRRESAGDPVAPDLEPLLRRAFALLVARAERLGLAGVHVRGMPRRPGPSETSSYRLKAVMASVRRRSASRARAGATAAGIISEMALAF